MKYVLVKQRSSVEQEKRIARDLGGRRVAGSGSQFGNKGDVKADRWLVEAKDTKSKSYALSLGTWRKIFSEATRAGREPALVIDICGRKLAVIDYRTFVHLQRFM